MLSLRQVLVLGIGFLSLTACTGEVMQSRVDRPGVQTYFAQGASAGEMLTVVSGNPFPVSKAQLEQAVTEANTAAAAAPETTPPPRPKPEIAVAAAEVEVEVDAPKPRPAELQLASVETAAQELEVVTRMSSSGGRHWGINVGRYPTRYQAERMLLSTALQELGALDEALRKVVQNSRGFEANFVGMTQEQAALACRRLEARGADCTTFGPRS